MKYSIDSVSQLTGIPQSSLRNWEKRHLLIAPIRLENGFREYSEEDVTLLKRVASLLKEGHTIGELSSTLQQGRALPSVRPILEASELDVQVEYLYSSLLAYHLESAELAYTSMQARYPAAKLFEAAIQPILIRTGTDWFAQRISIGQEHFVTAFMRARLMPT